MPLIFKQRFNFLFFNKKIKIISPVYFWLVFIKSVKIQALYLLHHFITIFTSMDLLF